MEVDYILLGQRIRQFRLSRHYTQSLLAEKAEIEPSNLSHIERGATKVSLPTLVKIANALSVSMDELLCGSLEKNAHVSAKELNEALSDCTDRELASILEIVKTTKKILRK